MHNVQQSPQRVDVVVHYFLDRHLFLDLGPVRLPRAYYLHWLSLLVGEIVVVAEQSSHFGILCGEVLVLQIGCFLDELGILVDEDFSIIDVELARSKELEQCVVVEMRLGLGVFASAVGPHTRKQLFVVVGEVSKVADVPSLLFFFSVHYYTN